MSNNQIRRVVASENTEEIIKIVESRLRSPFSNEAIVNVTTISLNRGELGRARRAADGKLQIGWDFTGTVERPAGDGSGPAAGMRVVGFSTRMEGWAEQVCIPTSYIAPIPDDVSDAHAATLPVAGLTALHAVDAGTSILGRDALITGATGGVGMFAVQLASLAGATAHAQIRRLEQKPFIESLGDYPVIVTSDGKDFSGYNGFRLIVDGVSGPILSNAISTLSPQGICVCYGVTETPEIPIDIGQFMRIGLAQMMGFHLYSKSEYSPPSENLPRLLSLVSRGMLNCAIERETSWSEIDRVAQDLLERRFLGKAVLHID